MAETLSRMLLNTLKDHPRPDFMLYKKDGRYVPLSTGEFGRNVRHFCLGLKELGLAKGEKVILLSENRPEWVMCDMANLCLGAITVPVYTTLVPEQIKYIINDSDARTVIVSNEEQWQKVAAVRGALGQVRHFISLSDDAPPGVLRFRDIMAAGEKLDAREPALFESLALPVQPEDQASLIYTSGTTGMPKGVILTHRNFVSNIVSVAEVIRFSEKDTVLSFLPLSHVLERMVTFTYVYRGCSIGYAESVETVAQNLLEVRPHIMVSVPRVFEKIYAKIMDNVLTELGAQEEDLFLGGRRREGLRRRGRSTAGPFRPSSASSAPSPGTLVFSKVVQKTGAGSGSSFPEGRPCPGISPNSFTPWGWSSSRATA